MIFKRFLPSSLFGRGLLIVVLPTVLVQMVATIIFFDRHWSNVTKHMSRALAGEVAFMAALMGSEEEAGRARLVYLLREHTGIDASYRSGMTLASVKDTDFPDLQQELARQLSVPFTVEKLADGNVGVRVALARGVLTLIVSNKRLESPTTLIFFLWMGGASVLFLCIALLFLRNQVRPIRELAEAAERFGKGRDTQGFKPSGAQEVRRAGRAFLVMRERIQRQIRTRTDMLSGISHDLRTPLTRMKLQLAMLSSEEAKELGGDVRQMESMIQEYLDYARGGGGEESITRPLPELLAESVADYTRAGLPVMLGDIPEAVIEVRPQGFKRMLHNLIDNGLRYGKLVRLSARLVAGKAEILVDDEGEGIPPDRREEAFRPFTRLDAARNLNEGGVGLGLTIARDIAMQHGGEVMLDDSPVGGLRAVVRLPL